MPTAQPTDPASSRAQGSSSGNESDAASAGTEARAAESWFDAMRPLMQSMGDAMGQASPVAAAWMAEWKRASERAAAWPKVAKAFSERKEWATPFDVVASEGSVRLLRFRLPEGEAAPPRRFATPLLMVFALVNRPYVLDLLPNKSVVRQYLRAGFEVYMVDWGTPQHGDGAKTLHDYVEGHLDRLVRRVLALTGQPQLNLFGYCMGGTLSAMYTSLHGDVVRNLTMLAAPVDWSRGESLLKCWTSPATFDVDAIADAFDLVPSGYLGTSFNLLKPVDNNLRKWQGFLEKMDDERFLREFVAMESWVNDNIPISSAVYRDFVKHGLQGNRLAQGEFPLGAARIDLRRITCPVLNLVAETDHLVPREQSDPLDRLVGSSDVATRSLKAGHIGLAVSGKAHGEFWPAAADWLAARSTPAT